jgi:G patch domain-containing protein 1
VSTSLVCHKILFFVQDNYFGIGYRGLDRGGGSGNTSGSAFSLKSGVAKKKFSISGEAFGVGVYEEDDEDVYNR